MYIMVIGTAILAHHYSMPILSHVCLVHTILLFCITDLFCPSAESNKKDKIQTAHFQVELRVTHHGG
jgi:hypothetical protein